MNFLKTSYAWTSKNSCFKINLSCKPIAVLLYGSYSQKNTMVNCREMKRGGGQASTYK